MTQAEFKKIRTNLGITQKQFAEMLGYDTPVSILRKESGQTPITKQDQIIIQYILMDNLKANPKG